MKKFTEINAVRVEKKTLSSTYFIRLRFQGYRCKSGFAIFPWKGHIKLGFKVIFATNSNFQILIYLKPDGVKF